MKCDDCGDELSLMRRDRSGPDYTCWTCTRRVLREERAKMDAEKAQSIHEEKLMKTIFKWLMNPDNNPIMFAVTIAFVILCVVASFIRCLFECVPA